MVLIIKCCVVQKQRRKITHIFLIDKIFRRVFVKKIAGMIWKMLRTADVALIIGNSNVG